MKTKFLIPGMALILIFGCKKESQITPQPIKTVINVVDPKKDTTSIKQDTLADKSWIRLKVLNDADTVYSDETELMFYKSSTTAYSKMEDAVDMQGLGDVDFALLSSDNIPLSIDHTPFLSGMEIGLTFKSKETGNFTIRISGTHTIPKTTHIWIKDIVLKDSVDLKVANYNFKSDTSRIASRFKIILN